MTSHTKIRAHSTGIHTYIFSVITFLTRHKGKQSTLNEKVEASVI